MKALRFLPIVTVALALHMPALAQEKKKDDAKQEEASKLVIDIPPAVQATIQKEKGDGKVVEFRRANDNDGTTYVIILLLDGKNYSLSLDAGGRVISKQLDEDREEPKPLSLDDLPANIKKTLLREAGGAPIKGVEVRQEKKSYFTEIIVGTRRYIIEIDADGKLVRKQHAGEAGDR